MLLARRILSMKTLYEQKTAAKLSYRKFIKNYSEIRMVRPKEDSLFKARTSTSQKYMSSCIDVYFKGLVGLRLLLVVYHLN